MEDFGLLRFLPLAIEDRASVARVLEDADKANGCAFSGLADAAGPMPPELIYGAGVKGVSTGPSHAQVFLEKGSNLLELIIGSVGTIKMHSMYIYFISFVCISYSHYLHRFKNMLGFRR